MIDDTAVAMDSLFWIDLGISLKFWKRVGNAFNFFYTTASTYEWKKADSILFSHINNIKRQGDL